MFLRDCKSLYSMRADCKSARTGQQICTNGDGNLHERGGVPFACDVFAGLQIPILYACGLQIRTNKATNPHERGWESARTGLTDDAAGGVDCCIMMKQLHGHDAAIALSCISNDNPAGFWAEGCAGGGGTLLGSGRRGVLEAVEPSGVWTDGLLGVDGWSVECGLTTC